MKNTVTKSNKGERLIRGAILKFVDGRWSTDGVEVPASTRLFAIGTTKALQCWKNGELLDQKIERPDEPLGDPDELNAKIPESEWGTDFNGKPKPPWSTFYVIYLISPDDASTLTCINDTTGQRIAFDRLESRVNNFAMMFGAAVPLVALDTRPMKTNWGVKQRPKFTVVKDEWKKFGGDGGQPALLPSPTDGGPAGAAAKPEKSETKSAAKQTLPGKPVTRPTVGETIDDSLPDFA
jgi:hypothetical protein